MKFPEYFPNWNKLSIDHQKRLQENAIAGTVKKGTIIHNGSIDCTGLYLIKSGQLRAYILSEEGREITIYRLFERDICLFSASCMMNSIQFEIIIEAEKDTEYWMIPVGVYKQIMEESAPIANFTNEIMASRFSEVMWLLEQIIWKSFDKRLATFLLNEAEIEGTTTLRITHEAIGNHLGNPREVVTRMLKYFSSEEIVKLSRGTIEICDEKRLLDITEA